MQFQTESIILKSQSNSAMTKNTRKMKIQIEKQISFKMAEKTMESQLLLANIGKKPTKQEQREIEDEIRKDDPLREQFEQDDRGYYGIDD